MKLRNKRTGEIVEATDFNIISDYNSLAELNEEWEDYEEPKEYWLITWCGEVDKETDDGMEVDKDCKVIGNYFSSREEAEQAIEKLKAWKRLKDKGFKFVDFNRINDCASLIRATFDESWSEIYDDLDLLFGGEQ